MKRDFLKELELTDDQINSIMAEHGKTVNDVKDKADKVDTLESQITDYKSQLEDRDKQLDDLKGQAQGNEDLQKQIQDLQKANEDTKTEYEQKLNQQLKESKLDMRLKDAGARNLKSVKANLDLEKISLDGDNLVGLDEQLNPLKESESYLFGEAQPKGLAGREPVPGDDNSQPKGITKEQFNQMSYSDRLNLYQEKPDVYKQLTE